MTDSWLRGLRQHTIKREALFAGGDHHPLAVLHATAEHELGEGILHRFLNDALERPRAIGGIPALLRPPLACRWLELKRDLAVLQKLGEARHLDVDDLCHLAALEPVEENDLIDAVEEFGPEACPHHRHDLIA